jgi:hypothetical protein
MPLQSVHSIVVLKRGDLMSQRYNSALSEYIHAGNIRLTGSPCRVGAAEELLEIIMRRYERASTMLTFNRPVEDWGKLFGDAAAVSAMLDRLLHHGHVLKCGPRSWRTKTDLPPQEAAG